MIDNIFVYILRKHVVAATPLGVCLVYYLYFTQTRRRGYATRGLLSIFHTNYRG